MAFLFENIKKQLYLDEGKVKYAYKDSLGYWTIGVGHLIDKDKGGGLSDDEIEYILNNDVKRKYSELTKELPWVLNLSEPRIGVLLNMSFQMGVSGLLKFKNTLEMVKQGKYEEASKGMMNSLWAKQTPNRAKKLSKQMSTNEWQ
jgi:lysozyme